MTTGIRSDSISNNRVLTYIARIEMLDKLSSHGGIFQNHILRVPEEVDSRDL